MADTGVKYPASGTTSGSGATAWNGATNIYADDNIYTNFVHGNFSVYQTVSGTLTGSNYSLNIPSGATIDGIEVTVQAYYLSALRPSRDYRVQLKVGGSAVGSNKATLADWSTSETTRTYGGATDKWGLTSELTVANLNATGFGVEFQSEGNFNGSNQNAYCYVDTITVKVYYTASSATYTLTCTPLSIPVTKHSANLTVSRRLTATSKSVTVTKNNATLSLVKILTCQTKSVTVTTYPATLKVSRVLTCLSKSITVTPNNATLTPTKKITAQVKYVPVSPKNATLKVSRVLTAQTKAVTVTNNSANLTVSRVLQATSKSVTVTKNNANLTVQTSGRVLTATPKSITVTTYPATLTVSRKLTCTSKAVTVTKSNAVLTLTRKITAISKAVTVTKNSAILKVSRKLVATAKAITVTKNAANLLRNRTLTCTSKAITVTPRASILKVSRKLLAVAKSVTVTRNTATLFKSGGGVTLTAVSKAVTVTKRQAVLKVTRRIMCETKYIPLSFGEVLFKIQRYDHYESICSEVFDMATAVEICNIALGLSGSANHITSLTEGSTEAMACRSYYGQTRQELMQAVPWGFLRVQRSLSILADASVDGWDYTYAYPCDCLEPLFIKPSTDGALAAQFSNVGEMRDAQNSNVPWVRGTWANPSGGYKRIISTNKENAILVYQADISDTSIYPPDFLSLFTTTLAGKLATFLGNAQIAGRLVQEAAAMLQQLRAKHAVEYNTDRKTLVYDPTPDILSVRG